MSNKNLGILVVLIALAVVGYFLYGDRLMDRSAGNTPPQAEEDGIPEAARNSRGPIADDLGVSANRVRIVSAIAKEWPNSCLGLAGSEEICLQVITPGYQVLAEVDGNSYIYRTNADGSAARRE